MIYRSLLHLSLILLTAAIGSAQSALESLSFKKSHTSLSIHGEVQGTFWAADGPAAGLLKFGDDIAFGGRLTLQADALISPYFYLHAKARYDTGFDPLDEPDGQTRIDEAFLRYRPLGGDSLNIQIGKSATIFGGWVPQHEFHDDPFLIPPLAYGQILGIGALNPNALSPAAIQGRLDRTLPGIFETRKRLWASTIWGPAYTTGLTITGTQNHFDYALEVKNIDSSAHPDQWNGGFNDFSIPAVAARIAYRPDASWLIGTSYSRGSYLDPVAAPLLPDRTNRNDLIRQSVGFDLRYAAGDWIFSGEAIHSQFDTIASGTLRSTSWHTQARWKIDPSIWLAARIGQTINNDTRQGLEWSPDLIRTELALGYRITADTLLKTQYAYTESTSTLAGPGRHIFSLGVNLRF